MCVLKPSLDLDIFAHMLQGCDAPAMWTDSMCFLRLPLASSYPYTLQLTAFLLPVFFCDFYDWIDLFIQIIHVSSDCVFTNIYSLASPLFESSWFCFMCVFIALMCSKVWWQYSQIICTAEWRLKIVWLFVAKFQFLYSHLMILASGKFSPFLFGCLLFMCSSSSLLSLKVSGQSASLQLKNIVVCLDITWILRSLFLLDT